jgi:hypothetical protein
LLVVDSVFRAVRVRETGANGLVHKNHVVTLVPAIWVLAQCKVVIDAERAIFCMHNEAVLIEMKQRKQTNRARSGVRSWAVRQQLISQQVYLETEHHQQPGRTIEHCKL